MFFPGYHPPGYRSQPAEPADVPLAQFKAAQAVNASHLSRDGKRVYCTRYGQPLEAKWQGWDGYGAWEECEAIPGDAVVIDARD